MQTLQKWWWKHFARMSYAREFTYRPTEWKAAFEFFCRISGEVSLAVLHSSSIKYTAKKLWIIHSVVGCVNEYIERYGRDTAAERYVTPYCRCESHSRRATDEIESECSTQWKRWLAAAHTTHQRPTHGAAIFKCYELHSNYASVFFLSLPSSPSSPSLLSSSADGNDPVCCWLVFASASRTCTNFHLDIYCKWSRVGAGSTHDIPVFFFLLCSRLK